MTITVVQVIRELGIEPAPELSWSVGCKVRDIYERSFGHLPPKELRHKTNDHGTHCFAIYPDNMRPVIANIVREHRTEAARQTSLPFDDPRLSP